jgi:hypothetical protein
MRGELFICGRNEDYSIQKCLEEISKESPRNASYLSVHDLNITPPILALLLQVLNQRRNVPWLRVHFCNCKILEEIDGGVDKCNDADEEGQNSPNDLDLFASFLATRIHRLSLKESPTILACLGRARELEIAFFLMEQKDFSTVDLINFVDFVERNLMLEGFLLNNMSIKSSSYGSPKGLHLRNSMYSWEAKRRQFQLAETFIGQGHLGRLLYNHQTQLQELTLKHIHLQDRHLIAIVQMLPTSHLEMLDVSENMIECQGVLMFAQEMPRMQYLNEVRLDSNSWEYLPAGYEECCAALVQGLSQNYSIMLVQTGIYDDTLAFLPLRDLLHYYGALNWAGRRIITDSNTFPVGLWPLLLARSQKGWLFSEYKADMIYLFLRKSTLFKSINACEEGNPEQGMKKRVREETKTCVQENMKKR